ncbi:hypothetical protein HY522_01765 [bacterium]|nr:hypothetical protein [bacterium]
MRDPHGFFLTIAAGLFVLTFAFVVFRQWSGRRPTRPELVWTAVPPILLAGLAAGYRFWF